jgi:hypothetical protein
MACITQSYDASLGLSNDIVTKKISIMKFEVEYKLGHTAFISQKRNRGWNFLMGLQWIHK